MFGHWLVTVSLLTSWACMKVVIFPSHPHLHPCSASEFGLQSEPATAMVRVFHFSVDIPLGTFENVALSLSNIGCSLNQAILHHIIFYMYKANQF